MDAVLELDPETMEEIPVVDYGVEPEDMTPAEEYQAAVETTITEAPVKARKPRKQRQDPPISFRDNLAQQLADRLAEVDAERNQLIAARKALGMK